MELKEILRARRSVRKFEDRAVEREVVEELLKQAFTAPSSRNTRSTRYMVVEGREMMERIAQMRDYGSAFMKDCPMAIMVAGDESVTDLWVDNCSISATILQLAVTDAGLGSCWVHVNGRPHLKAEPEGQSAEEYLREFLPIPAEWRPLCFIALGYPAQEVKPHSEKDDSDKVIWVK